MEARKVSESLGSESASVASITVPRLNHKASPDSANRGIHSGPWWELLLNPMAKGLGSRRGVVVAISVSSSLWKLQRNTDTSGGSVRLLSFAGICLCPKTGTAAIPLECVKMKQQQGHI